MKARWTNDPAWPSGIYPATLDGSLPYQDPDWPAGDVTKERHLSFETGQSRTPSRGTWRYDLIRPDGTRGVDDGSFPIRAYSKATSAFLPKTEAGDGARLVLLAYRGEVVPGELPVPEPTETGARVWTTGEGVTGGSRRPGRARSSRPAARALPLHAHRLAFNVIPDGDFVVHRCPRFDHSAPGAGRPCTLSPVASVNGQVDNFALNPGGAGATDSRGYLGLELTRAPEGLGDFFVMVESLSQEYRLRRQSDLMSTADVANGEFQGAFKLVNVGDYPCPDARCGTGGCNQCTGSPNYVSTGTYTTAATDMVVPTTGPAMTISRNYVSTPSFDGIVGPGWTSSLEARVYLAPLSPAASVSVQRPMSSSPRACATSSASIPSRATTTRPPAETTTSFETPTARSTSSSRGAAVRSTASTSTGDSSPRPTSSETSSRGRGTPKGASPASPTSPARGAPSPSAGRGGQSPHPHRPGRPDGHVRLRRRQPPDGHHRPGRRGERSTTTPAAAIRRPS